MPVSVPPTAELSPAEQLKQMAAQQQQRAKLIQQNQQSQGASWSPAAPPTSPYGAPTSPMMYPQGFNGPSSMVAKPLNNYVPQNHMNMLNQSQAASQAPAGLGAPNALNKQLSYSNTKPLSHFSGVEHMSHRMTPPMANQAKNPMMPYMHSTGAQTGGPTPAQGPMPGQTAHLTEEQKRMMLMKQKVLGQALPYRDFGVSITNRSDGTCTSVKVCSAGDQKVPRLPRGCRGDQSLCLTRARSGFRLTEEETP
uniref:Mastermind-like transcriptional coactivator 3 n=1 Tax=Electrophorus electricus TaxID=8005 RepID=A0A4W4EH51_ELEEL